MTREEFIKKEYREYQFSTTGIDVWEEGAFRAGFKAALKKLSLPPADATAEEISAKDFVNKYYQLPESRIKLVRISSLIKCLERFAAQRQPQPTAELQILMNDISEWSDKTFGDGQRNPAIVYHLKKEVSELIEAIELFQKGTLATFEENVRNRVFYEYADCMMLLLDSAFHFGLNAEKLLSITRAKLEINKARKWGKPDANGVVEHIKQPSAEGAEEKTIQCPDCMAYHKVTDNEMYKCWNCGVEFRYQHKPQPTAEGAEEILDDEFADKEYKIEGHLRGKILRAMRTNATLHAQRIAEKMVSERDDDVFDKMNCLIGYLERWLSNPQSNNPPAELRSVIDEAIEYLKSREPQCNHEGTTIAWGPDANKCTKCELTWSV